MKPPQTIVGLVILLWLAFALGLPAADDYVAGPDSKPQEGVPQGTLLKFTLKKSKIFPGSIHDYWVYVPAEYTPDKPACVYIGQDGIQFEATNVFDNLIYKKQMPVTIGVFVKPGVLPAADPTNALDRFNRSFEYDGLGDNYARFLLEDLLPKVEQLVLPDGRAVHLSHDGNDRCIGGLSSGAICAFTAAWERPDAFRRVFSAIGTYVDLRGGLVYPSLIRKYEPKPIRIFMQDGSGDLNIYGGDWWMANQTMERALTFAGYDVNHAWGDGGHSGKQGTAVFPDAMRWLWRDWPQPIKPGPSLNNTLTNILIAGEDWQWVADVPGGADGPAVNAKGEVYFSEVRSNRIWRVGTDGHREVLNATVNGVTGEAFGPDGKLYAVGKDNTVMVIDGDTNGTVTRITGDIHGNDLVVGRNGNIYVTEPPPAVTNASSRIWLVRPDGDKKAVGSGPKFANGITFSPDQSLLYVGDYHSHWVYSFVVQPDGTLANRQKYDWLHARDTDDDSGADGMRVDREGRLYVATRMGIQVCDQAGRVQCILPTPGGRIVNLVFGGEKFDTVYALCGNQVFKRRFNVTGANSWDLPNRPAPPKL